MSPDDDDLFDDDFDPDEKDDLDDEELVGRLPSDEPYGGDEAPIFSDPDAGLTPDQARSRRAHFGGEERDLKEARAQFKIALDRAADRSGLLWYLARVYADKGYFADSAALLSSLIAAAPNHTHALRLYAEMLWWREHSWQVPWIH